jgi:hypothetical protein
LRSARLRELCVVVSVFEVVVSVEDVPELFIDDEPLVPEFVPLAPIELPELPVLPDVPELPLAPIVLLDLSFWFMVLLPPVVPLVPLVLEPELLVALGVEPEVLDEEPEVWAMA